MDKIKVVIIANFTLDFSATDNGRFRYIAKELSKDCDVEIITSDFYHGGKYHRNKTADMQPFRVTFIEEPGYKHNICLKRFYSHYIWGRNVAKYLKTIKKPDVVYCAIPSLTAAYEAAKYCKKNKIRFVIDVQDLWPEAFRMQFNVSVLCDIIYAPFKYLADKIYASADAIVAVSQTYLKRALSVNKKCSNGLCVFLGTNLKRFDANAKNNRIMKPDGSIWLGYCGMLGKSYDLITIFDALAILKAKGIEIPEFIVMGNGPRRHEFEEYAKRKDLSVQFTGWLPYDKMCGMLCACDIVVNPITKKSCATIINKHADYAASGLPILNTQVSVEYRTLVEKYQMGFNCECGNAADLAEKLQTLVSDIALREKMGKNARKCAEDRFDRDNIYRRIINVVTS